MSRINWTQVLVFGLAVLVVFLIGLSLLPILFGGYWGMGPGMMGPGMMGGVFSPVFTLLGLLIPVGLLVLLIVGGVWVVRNIAKATAPPAPARTCPACDQPIEPDWRHCRYWSEAL